MNFEGNVIVVRYVFWNLYRSYRTWLKSNRTMLFSFSFSNTELLFCIRITLVRSFSICVGEKKSATVKNTSCCNRILHSTPWLFLNHFLTIWHLKFLWKWNWLKSATMTSVAMNLIRIARLSNDSLSHPYSKT